MESPAARLTVHNDTNNMDLRGPPSSPFVSEVDPQSRMASKQWPSTANAIDDPTVDVFMTPAPMKAARSPRRHADADKENTPQHPSTVQKLSASPHKLSTPERRSPQRDGTPGSRHGEPLADLIPPPSSMRKSRASPTKTPLKVARSVAATPQTGRREQQQQQQQQQELRTVERTNFQAGLDMRASHASLARPDLGNIDDTCFSAFSEAPDMTQYARLSQSTTKHNDVQQTPRSRRGDATPRVSRKRPSLSRSPSPTPRRMKTPAQMNNDGTTSFLIDFTQQIESVSSYQRGTPARSSNNPGLLQYLSDQRSPAKSARPSFATPAKSNSILNLLDFELPPAPTPRSIPTITVRELESLKSSYLSQISGLKATLSGREAEVESLKRAIGDAERRAGEAQEHLREEKCRREQAEEEKTGWERRGEELANVLKNVREEVLKSEAEKEDFIRKFEESEQRAEDAEIRANQAEERLTSALAERATDPSSGNNANDDKTVDERVQALVAAQIDAKIESVGRDLHAIYKEKHERKVATLKKSYEARSEKKCADLLSRLADLEKQNEELHAARDATFSGALPDLSMVASASESASAAVAEAQELKILLEEQKAHLARVAGELESAQRQQDALMQELEQERVEKGELVAAVDEMLALQSLSAAAPAPPAAPSSTTDPVGVSGSATPAAAKQRALSSAVEDLRRSIARPTGLRAPSSSSNSSGLVAPSESRIGKSLSSSSSTAATSAGIPTPARSLSGGLGKSRMLANIERMGRTGSGGVSGAPE